jgi:hypothetical protein
VLFIALIQSGCVAPGNLGMSPTNLNFGNVPIGSSSSKIVTITNSNSAPFTITQAAVSGKGFDIKVPSLPLALGVGQSAQLTTTFTPAAIGNTSGSVLITKTQLSSPQLVGGSASATPSVTTEQATIAMTGAGVPVTPSITTQPVSQTVTAGQAATFLVAASGEAPLTYQWRKNGTSISGATSTTYTTPASATSDSGSQFSVVVSNSAGNVTSNVATLTVNAAGVAPSITTQPTSQTVTVGQTATFSVTSSGATPLSYQWRKNGTSISGATSASYSTAAATASDSGSQFTVVVGNSAGNVTSNAAILTVNAAPGAPLQITTTLLPNAQAGIHFQVTLNATGGVQPYHWSIASGALPSGLSLSASTGLLSGNTSLGGKFDFSVQVSDSSSPSPQTAMKPLALSVLAFALQISSGGLPNGQVGVPFDASVSASGGVTPYTWAVTGALPSGLSLNASTGVITGTPTQAGASTFTIVLTDSSQQTTQKPLSLTISAAGVQPLAISTTTLAQPAVGQAYAATLQATGGTPPYTWSIQSGPLSTGLSLSTSGQITGTPIAAGQASFNVQVADSASPPTTASKAFSLNPAAAAAPITLDQYGGDANHACAGTLKNGNPISGATGFFYLYKDTNLKHWMFCDPTGNRYWMTAVQVVDYGGQNYANIVNAKYGPFRSLTGWEAIQTKRLQAMGFNTVGEFSRFHLWPPGGDNPNPIPFNYFISPAHYFSGVKDVFANLPPKWDTFQGYRGYRSLDLYDPLWQGLGTGAGGNLWNCTLTLGISCATFDASPWLVLTTMDDVAFVSQIYTNQSNYAVAITAPFEQFENSFGYGRQQVFSDPVMHNKQQWGVWLCNTRYASLTALNAAWGSTYSTCGSSATTAAPEAIGLHHLAIHSFMAR